MKIMLCNSTSIAIRNRTKTKNKVRYSIEKVLCSAEMKFLQAVAIPAGRTQSAHPAGTKTKGGDVGYS